MINSVRGKHSSPGIYFKETEITYSPQSLGITSLGAVGETLKGPAFQPMPISNWAEFQYYFGGTSTKKFRGTKYPKYELPFIAKSYLTESKELSVVRVLGLSGYNAGPAWLICAKGSGDGIYVVAVIRSKAHYVENDETVDCTGSTDYDKIVYDVESVEMKPYSELNWTLICDGGSASASEVSYEISSGNLGRFCLEVNTYDGRTLTYPVSLNYGDKDYIYESLGYDNESGSSPLFVEELYDYALRQAIADGTVNQLHNTAVPIDPKKIDEVCGSHVVDFIRISASSELRKDGTFVYDSRYVDSSVSLTFYKYSGTGNRSEFSNYQEVSSVIGGIYYILRLVKYVDGRPEWDYYYVTFTNSDDEQCKVEQSTNEKRPVVYIDFYKGYFENVDNKIVAVQADMNDYLERFRPAVTPWFVSQVLGNGENYELKKMFRFTTISDGDAANKQIKISIEKIRPDDGTFNVVIRDYYDTDGILNVLERFNNCSMDPASKNYIGKKIGTTDGDFMPMSKYVTVEVAEDDTIRHLVPCGFLGYPRRAFDTQEGQNIHMFDLAYNTRYDQSRRPRRQYFGLSDITGVDVDVLTYKGRSVYMNAEDPSEYVTHGFHLDARVGGQNPEKTVTVDQITGYTFDTVEANAEFLSAPMISRESDTINGVYEDINTRKFTVYPYGGFDGWDIYRDSRTNTDKFKANTYKGAMPGGTGANFTENFDKSGLNLDGIRAISTDYYAYLAGYRQFKNPEEVDINLFVTPGIDVINNLLLTEDVINMIEDDDDGRKGDVLYIPTLPDKPAGASDLEPDMYETDEIIAELEETNIDSSYAATYFPWVKYYDQESGSYINLPATKDAVRDFAYTDNTAAPWFASAGINRGPVNCVKAHKFTKQVEEDALYDARINVIKTFASDGVKIWGNKTLSTTEGPLNRINVRRLMIRVKKLIMMAARQLIFEQNDATLRKQFQSLVEPILANVRANRGITDYRLDVQQSVECEDEHELAATIWIKPTPTLEYISINFNITEQCVTFDE